jgi:hypothetical protein
VQGSSRRQLSQWLRISSHGFTQITTEKKEEACPQISQIKKIVFERIPTSWNTGLFIIALMKTNFQLALSKKPVRLHRTA